MSSKSWRWRCISLRDFLPFSILILASISRDNLFRHNVISSLGSLLSLPHHTNIHFPASLSTFCGKGSLYGVGLSSSGSFYGCFLSSRYKYFDLGRASGVKLRQGTSFFRRTFQVWDVPFWRIKIQDKVLCNRKSCGGYRKISCFPRSS